MTPISTWARRKAIIALGMVDVRRGVFTPDQAAQVEAWRAENEIAIKEASQ